jgi:alpha-beta hydrolase superfamily lysophospholipase
MAHRAEASRSPRRIVLPTEAIGRPAGLGKLKTSIYLGARHETLNEINREEVTQDLIGWLDGVAGK